MNLSVNSLKWMSVVMCFLMLQGCQTASMSKTQTDDLEIWLQREMSRRGVTQTSDMSSSTLRGI